MDKKSIQKLEVQKNKADEEFRLGVDMWYQASKEKNDADKLKGFQKARELYEKAANFYGPKSHEMKSLNVLDFEIRSLELDLILDNLLEMIDKIQ